MSENESGQDLFELWQQQQRAQQELRAQRADELRAGAYRRDDPIPPVGTRVVHEEYGPGTIAGTPAHLSQWWIEIDTPVHVDGVSAPVDHVWVYPYLLRRETRS